MNRLLRKKKNKKTNGTFPPYLIFLAESYQIRVSDWQGEREMNQPWRAFRTKRKDVIAYGSSEHAGTLKCASKKNRADFEDWKKPKTLLPPKLGRTPPNFSRLSGVEKLFLEPGIQSRKRPG